MNSPTCVSRSWSVKSHGLISLCLALLPISCSTVPLRTAMRMNAFDESKFASLNPHELRIRMAVPDGFNLNVAETRLEVDLTASGQNQQEKFALEQVSEGLGTRSSGLFASSQPVQIYILRLSDDSVRRFAELQRFVGSRKVEKLKFSASFAGHSSGKPAPALRLWVDLLFNPKEGYFTLVNGYRVESKQSKTR